MPRFLDTRGQPTLGIGLCGRCGIKFPLAQLSPDRNSPGLMVCAKDNDEFDPYRLPARAPDRLNLPFVRPDIPLSDLPSVYEDYAYVAVLGDPDTGEYLVGGDGSGGNYSIFVYGLP